MLDFNRSFVVFEADFKARPPKTVSDLRQNNHNRARMRIDCHLELTDPTGKTTDFYLSEACKTERVGRIPGLSIFTQPNADFHIVMSEKDCIVIKSWDKHDKGVMLDPPSLGPQPERQSITTDVFYKHNFILNEAKATVLKNAAAVIESAGRGDPINARTEYDANGYHVVLDYPVKLINVTERQDFYQTDTGPILFPDLAEPKSPIVQNFWLAFSAFNDPSDIELIVNRPTPIGNGVSVNHYSEPVFIKECVNTLFSVE